MEDSDDVSLPASDSPCKECKRRRAKCDRRVPECTTCIRSKRHCLYERHSRTPLTRKHLTQVEAKLERAELLLAKYKQALKANTSASAMQLVSFSGQDKGLANLGLSADPMEKGTQSHANGSASEPQVDGFCYKPAKGTSTFPHQNGSAAVEPPVAPPTLVDPGNGICDNSHVSLDSMDWDERHKPMSYGDARSWRQHLLDASSPLEGENDVLDGMAMLSVDGKEVGYIGVASGAAFLKYLWKPTAQSTKRQSPSDQSQSQQSTATSTTQADFSLPADVGLRRVIADSFLHAYFSLFHPYLPIVHEETFRAVQHGRRRASSPAVWNVLANIMAAIGAFSAMTECLTVDTPFFFVAKAAMKIDMLESGSVVLVQALTLMSYYLQKRNKLNSSYTYAGLAMKVAFGLGLHREFPNWNLSPLAREVRRRVFWGTFTVDASICMTLSRPISSARYSTDIAFPSNIEDSALREASLKPAPVVVEMTNYSGLRALAEFFLTADNIYKCLIKSPYPSLEELIVLDKQHLNTWYYLLPPAFREVPTSSLSGPFALTRLITLCRQSHLRMIMYRPFLVPFLQKVSAGTDSIGSGSVEAQGYGLCIQAAHDTIELTSQCWQTQTRTRLAAWYVLYFTFQAALIPTVCLRNVPNSTAVQNWRADIGAALDSVEDIHFIHASKCATVIHELSDPYMYDINESAAEMNVDSVFKAPDLFLEAQDFSMHFPTDGSFDFGADSMWPSMWPNSGEPDLDAKLEADLAELLMPTSAVSGPTTMDTDDLAAEFDDGFGQELSERGRVTL